MKLSRLLFSMYSYTKILSSPWMQQPRSLTRFTCCSLAMSMTSFLNSSKPCIENLDSRFTATVCPPSNSPWFISGEWIHFIIQSNVLFARFATAKICLYLVNGTKAAFSKLGPGRKVVSGERYGRHVKERDVQVIALSGFIFQLPVLDRSKWYTGVKRVEPLRALRCPWIVQGKLSLQTRD